MSENGDGSSFRQDVAAGFITRNSRALDKDFESGARHIVRRPLRPLLHGDAIHKQPLALNLHHVVRQRPEAIRRDIGLPCEGDALPFLRDLRGLRGLGDPEAFGIGADLARAGRHLHTDFRVRIALHPKAHRVVLPAHRDPRRAHDISLCGMQRVGAVLRVLHQRVLVRLRAVPVEQTALEGAVAQQIRRVRAGGEQGREQEKDFHGAVDTRGRTQSLRG